MDLALRLQEKEVRGPTQVKPVQQKLAARAAPDPNGMSGPRAGCEYRLIRGPDLNDRNLDAPRLGTRPAARSTFAINIRFPCAIFP